jgi:DNA replication protein DnaC
MMQELYKKLRGFKLSGIVNTLEERLSYANSKKLLYEEFLELLCEDEIDNRRDNSYKKRKARAKLPNNKKLEDFDFGFQASIDEREINDLASCKFISAKDNLILIGSPGTGKTHLAIGFALKALAKEYKVFFTTVTDMLYNLHIAKADNSYHKKLQQLVSYDLLILDELGFKPLPRYSVDDFFNVISKRYENKSTIITANKDLESWNNIFGDEELTGAITDRIIHHGKLLKITGPSYRTKKLKSEVVMT